MKLLRVTLTGADDSVDPQELVDLSAEFPFVEWGLLFSVKMQGQPRWPSAQWLARLCSRSTASMQFSAHLCGHIVRSFTRSGDLRRDFYEASGLPWLEEVDLFDRVQLNFHGEQIVAADRLFAALTGTSYILQCDGENDRWIERFVKAGAGLPLFDTSGGQGRTPVFWPTAWPGVRCGYAGGLGPDNLEEQLAQIAWASGAEECWVDMEGRLRSADDRQFDLVKARAVLEQAAPLISTMAV